jgi:hypothetical protein
MCGVFSKVHQIKARSCGMNITSASSYARTTVWLLMSLDYWLPRHPMYDKPGLVNLTEFAASMFLDTCFL